MKGCVILTAACLLASTSCTDRAGIATPPAIARQPGIRDIYSWGDDVAVITEAPDQDSSHVYRLATADRRRSRLVPFREVQCDSYPDVAFSSELGKLLVCVRGSASQLYRFVEEKWTSLSDPIAGREFRLAVERDRVAMISPTDVHVLPGTRTAALPAEVAKPGWSMPPSAALLSRDSLFLAYDRGEFGGALFRLDLTETPAAATNLTGSVRFLARDRAGAIWAASGIEHLGGIAGALYRVGRTYVETVALISGDVGGGSRKRAGVEFPGLTSVSGLAVGGDGWPIVVLTEFGVFKLTDSRFVPLYRDSMKASYEISLGGMSLSVGSRPVGVVATPAGEIYIATSDLGVLVIDGTSALAQLTFTAADAEAICLRRCL